MFICHNFRIPPNLCDVFLYLLNIFHYFLGTRGDTTVCSIVESHHKIWGPSHPNSNQKLEPELEFNPELERELEPKL